MTKDNVIWDNRVCMPLRPRDSSFLPQLKRHKDSGVNLIAINIYFDSHLWSLAPQMLDYFREWISNHPDEFVLVSTVDDIYRAKLNDRLAIIFTIESPVKNF